MDGPTLRCLGRLYLKTQGRDSVEQILLPLLHLVRRMILLSAEDGHAMDDGNDKGWGDGCEARRTRVKPAAILGSLPANHTEQWVRNRLL